MKKLRKTRDRIWREYGEDIAYGLGIAGSVLVVMAGVLIGAS